MVLGLCLVCSAMVIPNNTIDPSPLGLPLANIICRQGLASLDEPSFPLWSVFTDNSAVEPVSDAQRFSRVELVAHKVEGGRQCLAQRAEEARAALVIEGQAGIGIDHERLARSVDLIDDDLAVGV